MLCEIDFCFESMECNSRPSWGRVMGLLDTHQCSPSHCTRDAAGGSVALMGCHSGGAGAQTLSSPTKTISETPCSSEAQGAQHMFLREQMSLVWRQGRALPTFGNLRPPVNSAVCCSEISVRPWVLAESCHCWNVRQHTPLKQVCPGEVGPSRQSAWECCVEGVGYVSRGPSEMWFFLKTALADSWALSVSSFFGCWGAWQYVVSSESGGLAVRCGDFRDGGCSSWG